MEPKSETGLSPKRPTEQKSLEPMDTFLDLTESAEAPGDLNCQKPTKNCSAVDDLELGMNEWEAYSKE